MSNPIKAYGIDWGKIEMNIFSPGKKIIEELANEKHTCLPKEQSLKKKLLESFNSDFHHFKIREAVVFSSLAKGNILDHKLFSSLLEEFYLKWKWNENESDFEWEILSTYKINYHLRANREATRELTALIDPKYAKEQRLRKMFDNTEEDRWLQKEQDRIESYITELIGNYLEVINAKEKALDFIPKILVARHQEQNQKLNRTPKKKNRLKIPKKKA